jgi:hypothetical protein
MKRNKEWLSWVIVMATCPSKSLVPLRNSESLPWIFLACGVLHHLAGSNLQWVPHRSDAPQTVRKYANMFRQLTDSCHSVRRKLSYVVASLTRGMRVTRFIRKSSQKYSEGRLQRRTHIRYRRQGHLPMTFSACIQKRTCFSNFYAQLCLVDVGYAHIGAHRMQRTDAAY